MTQQDSNRGARGGRAWRDEEQRHRTLILYVLLAIFAAHTLLSWALVFTGRIGGELAVAWLGGGPATGLLVLAMRYYFVPSGSDTHDL